MLTRLVVTLMLTPILTIFFSYSAAANQNVSKLEEVKAIMEAMSKDVKTSLPPQSTCFTSEQDKLMFIKKVILELALRKINLLVQHSQSLNKDILESEKRYLACIRDEMDAKYRPISNSNDAWKPYIEAYKNIREASLVLEQLNLKLEMIHKDIYQYYDRISDVHKSNVEEYLKYQRLALQNIRLMGAHKGSAQFYEREVRRAQIHEESFSK